MLLGQSAFGWSSNSCPHACTRKLDLRERLNLSDLSHDWLWTTCLLRFSRRIGVVLMSAWFNIYVRMSLCVCVCACACLRECVCGGTVGICVYVRGILLAVFLLSRTFDWFMFPWPYTAVYSLVYSLASILGPCQVVPFYWRSFLTLQSEKHKTHCSRNPVRHQTSQIHPSSTIITEEYLYIYIIRRLANFLIIMLENRH